MHTYRSGGTVGNRVGRLRHEGERGRLDRTVLDGIIGARNHNGGRIGFGPDGMLYVTAGEIFQAELAADLKSLGGKILRIAPDGAIPQDNPFPGSPVYSYGHRNPQGLAWHPETGELFSSEHGPSGEFGLRAWDEINVIQAGANYGWPRAVGAVGNRAYVDPIVAWPDRTTAPSGIAFHQGALFVAVLRESALIRITLAREGKSFRASRVERWFGKGEESKQPGRLRDVVVGPDGHLYVLTSNRDGRGSPRPGDDTIYRLDPAP
jgi:quinoprotein glucose dehydrogenase